MFQTNKTLDSDSGVNDMMRLKIKDRKSEMWSTDY